MSQHPLFDSQSPKRSLFKPSGSAPQKELKPRFTSCKIWHTNQWQSSRRMWCTLLAASLLSACGTIPPMHSSGRYVSTQHGSARFADALKGAAEYCARIGLGVRHLGTDGQNPGPSISRFECIESK